ncbi:MAG: hypothetical protein ACR2MX_07430, partial [Cyclobacteriaceae bacterium]
GNERPVPYEMDVETKVAVGKKLVSDLKQTNPYTDTTIEIDVYRGTYEKFSKLYGFSKFDAAGSSAVFYGFAWSIANDRPYLTPDQMGTLYAATAKALLETSELKTNKARHLLDETMMLETVLLMFGLGEQQGDPAKLTKYRERVSMIVKKRFGIGLMEISLISK